MTIWRTILLQLLFLSYLSNAFDKVHYCHLIALLSSVGISESLKWFKSYLSDGHQKVVECRTSVFNKVSSGVAQGSILGPLHFIILTNSLQVNLCHLIPS